MEDNWKKKIKSYEEYDKTIKEMAKGAPSSDEELEEAIEEFGREWEKMSEKDKEEFRSTINKADRLARCGLKKEERQINKNKNKKKIRSYYLT
ncbi:MAG: hypothetical protein AAB309_06070 [Deltaproteobacteria bacterium]